MNLVEVDAALRKLRLSGMAATLEARLLEAQSERRAPIDLVSTLVHDELTRRADRLLARRIQEARFRDPQASLERFDFDFNPELNRRLVFDLATARFVERHEDALLLGPPAPGRATWRRPWASPPSSKATASPTARPTYCSKSWPTPRSMARGRTTWLRWAPCRS